MNKNYELTFALIKPHCKSHPYALQHTYKIILKNFEIIAKKELILTEQLAAEFYKEHKERFFYNRLQTSMCSGAIEALILAGENAISNWRNIMGPTKVYKGIYSHPMCLRSLFGLSDTRNVCHGSDSILSVRREIQLFFPEFSIDKWYDDVNLK